MLRHWLHTAQVLNRLTAHPSDATDIAYLLAILARIPRREMPDGAARRALAEAIRAGRVDNLYRPACADYWNIAWRDRPAWVDPRQRLSAYVAEQSAEQRGQG
jgi:hypothetical protein